MSRSTSSSSSSSTSQISLGAPGNSSYFPPSTPPPSREAPGCLPPPNTPKSVNISSSPSDREDLSSSNQSASLSIELSFSSQRSAPPTAPRDASAVAIELDTPGNFGYLPPTGIIPPPNTPQRQKMGEMLIDLNRNLPPPEMSFTPPAISEMRRIINRAGEMEIDIDVAPQQPAVASLGAPGNSTFLPIPQRSAGEIQPIQIASPPIQKTQTISPGDPGNSCFLPPTDSPPPPPAPFLPQQKESKPEIKNPAKALEGPQKKIVEAPKKSPAKPEETKKSPVKIEKSSKVVEGGKTPEGPKKKLSKVEQSAKTPETKKSLVKPEGTHKSPAKGGADPGKGKTKQPDAAVQQKKEVLKSKTPPPKISEKSLSKGKKE